MTVIQKLPVEFYVSRVTKGKKAEHEICNVFFIFSFSNKVFQCRFFQYNICLVFWFLNSG
jgi:hypothetical protein